MRERIETERLILRPLEFRDAAAIHYHCRDGSVARHTARITHPYPLLAAEMYVLATRAAAGRRNNFAYAIALKESDELIGSCAVFKRHSDQTDWEIGYWVGPEARGQGLATEAARCLLEAARDDLGPQKLIAGHFEDNPASGRVLEKLGFSYTGAITHLFCMGRMDYANSLDMVRYIG